MILKWWPQADNQNIQNNSGLCVSVAALCTICWRADQLMNDGVHLCFYVCLHLEACGVFLDFFILQMATRSSHFLIWNPFLPLFHSLSHDFFCLCGSCNRRTRLFIAFSPLQQHNQLGSCLPLSSPLLPSPSQWVSLELHCSQMTLSDSVRL